MNYIVKNNKFDRPFSEIRPGDYWESDARVVVANDRQLFAGWIGDHYPLHWDCGYAATTRYGSPILHEPAVLSFAFGLVPLKAPQVITFYGLNRLMYVGDVVMASARGLQTEKRTMGGIVTARLETLLSRGTRAMVAEILMLVQVDE